jgi:hypothetical protein
MMLLSFSIANAILTRMWLLWLQGLWQRPGELIANASHHEEGNSA